MREAPLPSSFFTKIKGQANAFLAASNTLIAVLSALSNSLSHPNVAQLQQEFGFESTFVYHQRHRDAYAALRKGKTPAPQTALHANHPQYAKW